MSSRSSPSLLHPKEPIPLGTLASDLPPDLFKEGAHQVERKKYSIASDAALANQHSTMPLTHLLTRGQEIFQRTGHPPEIPGKYAPIKLAIIETIRRLAFPTNRNTLPITVLYTVLEELGSGTLDLPIYISSLVGDDEVPSSLSTGPSPTNATPLFNRKGSQGEDDAGSTRLLASSRDCILPIRHLVSPSLIEATRAAHSFEGGLGGIKGDL